PILVNNKPRAGRRHAVPAAAVADDFDAVLQHADASATRRAGECRPRRRILSAQPFAAMRTFEPDHGGFTVLRSPSSRNAAAYSSGVFTLASECSVGS